MSTLELFIIAVGLSMDAFAVAICKGLSVKKLKFRHMLIVGLYFGAFQGLMPLAGYFLGKQFQDYIIAFDHWVAFVLLSIIGINMIREAVKGDDCDCDCDCDCSFGVKAMLPMAVATSIDALAVGVTFGLMPDVNIGFAVLFIGVITFVLSAVGVKIGNVFGAKFKAKAELAGGIILILMGAKILVEHLELIEKALALFQK
ncbi:MAG: manganese efflux pump [Clostridia bacterium]|nr:manganese efflux pump [Clostridia bacterium]